MKHCLECLIYLLNRDKNLGINGEVKVSKATLIRPGIQTSFTVVIFLVLTLWIINDNLVLSIAKRASDVMTQTRLRQTNKLEWWLILKISLRAKAGFPQTLVKRKLRLHSMYFPQNTLMLTVSRGEFSDLHSIFRLRALRYWVDNVNWSPLRDSKARAFESKAKAFEFLNGGQFTLSTQLIKPPQFL